MSNELIMPDGITLKPAPNSYIEGEDGFRQYLVALHGEFKKSSNYESSPLPLLFWCLNSSLELEHYPIADWTLVLKANVQFPRLWYLHFKNIWNPSFEESLSCDDWLDGKMPSNIPDYEVSLFIDFIFFWAELKHPSYNLLSKKRARYDTTGWYSASGNYEESPLQFHSLVRWRRHLLESKEFDEDSRVLLKMFEGYQFAYLLPPEHDVCGGIAFVSCDESHSIVKKLKKSNFRLLELYYFARKYHLEMVGTFFPMEWRKQRVHFLPKRVHVRKTETGVNVSIPAFYSIDVIKTMIDRDFYDLGFILDNKVKMNRSKSLFNKDMQRKLGSLIRRAMGSVGHPEQYTASCLRRLGDILGKFDLERMYHDKVPDIEKLDEDDESIVLEINDAIKSVDANMDERDIWYEALRYFTAVGVWHPDQI